MEIRQLKYFVGIVDAGSVSKASQKLRVAQPALSQQIANLEFEVKAKLLLRSAQGVMPTAAGIVLYRHARKGWALAPAPNTLACHVVVNPAYLGAAALGLTMTSACSDDVRDRRNGGYRWHLLTESRRY